MSKSSLNWFIASIVLACLSPAIAQTAPSSQTAAPTLKLHVDSVSSGEVKLYWWNVYDNVSRYLVARSDDGGKTWKIKGNEVGGSTTGEYFHTDTNEVESDTDYLYRLEAANYAHTPLSDPVEAHTNEKNLVDVVQGKAKIVGVEDFLKPGFWFATIWALLVMATTFIPHLIVAALIFALFYIGHRIARRVAVGSLQRANVDVGIHDLLLSILKWSILGFALVIACDQIGINIGAFLAGVSIVGLAVGLAAQDTLSNVIASIVIFWDKPFKVGDWITVDGQYGKVLRVTFRSTRVLTEDGDVLSAPNTYFIGNRLFNHSADTINWVHVQISIPKGVSIADGRAALLNTCRGDGRLNPDPSPKVIVESVDGDNVKVTFSFCIQDEAQSSALRAEYMEKAKTALDAIKI